MKRTVIAVRQNPDDQPRLYLVEPASLGPAAAVGQTFAFPQLNGSPKADGTILCEGLLTHDSIRIALQQALNVEPGSVYIECQAPQADDYPWEILFSSSTTVGPSFLNLASWPIGRMKPSNVLVSSAEITYKVPIRLLAVLSATGAGGANISAKYEWEALLEKLCGSGLPYCLKALICEDDLLQFGESRVGNLPADEQKFVTFERILDKAQLLESIRKFRPHVLHFFCHGSATDRPRLQIGTRGDWQAEENGSIDLEADELFSLGDPLRSTWLVVLNCCDGATSAHESVSFAASLVASGFPAALGMRQKVPASTATEFTKHFYPRLLVAVRTAQPDREAALLDWAQLVGAARRGLLNSLNNAENDLDWSLPVIYCRREPFRLRRVSNQVIPGEVFIKLLELMAQKKEFEERSATAEEPLLSLFLRHITALREQIDALQAPYLEG